MTGTGHSPTSTTGKTTSAFAFLELAGTHDIRAGDTVYALGNPLGLGLAVSSGIISATVRDVERYALPCVMSSADISQGSSGGALLNMSGEVIGVNTAKLSSTGVEGMGYAIPVSEIKTMVNTLKTQTTTLTVKKQTGTNLYYYYRSK